MTTIQLFEDVTLTDELLALARFLTTESCEPAVVASSEFNGAFLILPNWCAPCTLATDTIYNFGYDIGKTLGNQTAADVFMESLREGILGGIEEAASELWTPDACSDTSPAPDSSNDVGV